MKLVTATIVPPGSICLFSSIAMDSGSNQFDKDSNCPDALPVGESIGTCGEYVSWPGLPTWHGIETKGVSSAAQGNLYDHSEREVHPRSC